MNKTFRQVLLAINFSSDPEMVMERVRELLADGHGALHLVCIVSKFKVAVNQPWLAISASGISESDLFRKAEEWMDQCRNIFRKNLHHVLLSTEIVSGVSLQKELLNCISRVNPHIVMIPDRTGRISMELAGKTHSTLLTFLGDGLNRSIETLVIPVGNLVPHKELVTIVSSLNKQNFKIYMVSVAKGERAASTRSTTDAFRIIKSSIFCDVEHRILEGSGLLKATKSFSNRIKADAILYHLNAPDVGPEDQSGMDMRPYKNRPYLFNN